MSLKFYLLPIVCLVSSLLVLVMPLHSVTIFITKIVFEFSRVSER